MDAAERATAPAHRTDHAVAGRAASWRGPAVLGALMLAAFTFNTAENLPVGLLELISAGLHVPLSAVGLLVTGYGVTVAIASVPLAHGTRAVPRRHVLTGLLAALVASSLLAASAYSYGLLLFARLLTALAQALFWAVMGPVAVGLFPPRVRGRVIAALSVAGSLALVLGVPAGTWLGRCTDWRVSMGAPAALGAVSLVTIAALLPTSPPEEEPAAYASGPDARRFATVLAAGALSATGAFTGYTYIVRFLGGVGGFSPGAVDVLLVVFGTACLAGVSVTGALLDCFPRAALITAVAVQAVGMLGLYALGARPVAAVVFLALTGGALGPVFMTTQNEMLRCAPGRTDIALAANSGAYNAGIAAGAALGALVLPLLEVRGTFLVGGLLTAAACAVLLGTRRRRRP
ncbi:MFS transporter, DHA1 family, L-arabinose/isopropyl-beta-D-thiogalactopyranoside export protein [Streptomyces misionensis]|uniref:MFS transporter, DHA1 family, L-arabinose/isopropyl-beta-D-thiogalactopyranoside export protein n=2 Tax=Streptomyces misionensis TaxID=67331 RepID=A0A1H5GSR9_9ACTN|nr:MFS transporter, DHA1 family, L-arabinose/isopropyl-beta-D-thiogalactopyranoside export protein [Streptomyces misionensis]